MTIAGEGVGGFVLHILFYSFEGFTCKDPSCSMRVVLAYKMNSSHIKRHRREGERCLY